MDFGFQNGFLDFKVDFWISKWISGFQSGFLDFKVDFWISSGFQDFKVDFWIHFNRYYSEDTYMLTEYVTAHRQRVR